MTFDKGYTIEAFVKLPSDFDGSHAWCGLFSRMGSGGNAGKTGDDPSEPTGTLNLDGGGAVQWAVFPRNQNVIVTNWSHLLPLDTWWHIAVVNDGTHTIMYIDGCPVVGNPSTPATGVASTGEFWMLGAYDYDRIVEQSFHGWLGDMRVVGRWPSAISSPPAADRVAVQPLGRCHSMRKTGLMSAHHAPGCAVGNGS